MNRWKSSGRVETKISFHNDLATPINMSKQSALSNLTISHQLMSHSLRSSLQSLDNQSAPLENVLHPAVFFGNIHSKQPRKSLYPKSNQHFHVTDTKRISLQQAARDGRLDIVKNHIETIGRDKKKLNKKDSENTTALHYAVRYNHVSIVKLLVESGASVNVQGEHGATPLHYASRYRRNNPKCLLGATNVSQNSKDMYRSRRRGKAFRNFVGVRKKGSGLLGVGRGAKRKNEDQGGMKLKGRGVNKRKLIHRLFPPLFSRKEQNNQASNDESTSQCSTPNHESETELCEIKTLIDIERPGNELRSSSAESSKAVPHIINEQATPEKESKKRANFDDYDEYFVGAASFRPESDRTSQDISNLAVDGQARARGSSVLDPKDAFLDISLDSRPPVKSASMPDIQAVESREERFDKEKLVADTDIAREAVKEKASFGRCETFTSTRARPLHIQKRLGDYIADANIKEGRSLDTLWTTFGKESGKDKKQQVTSIILYLLEKNANINGRDYYGAAPLHYAAQRGNVVAMQELLSHPNIDIEAKDRTQMTALHCACSNGSLDVVEVLIESGADFRCTDEEELRPLHFAAMEGHLAVVKLLFNCGEQKGGWHTLSRMIMDEDRDGQTALHLAVENGHIHIVEECLKNGANVNHYNVNLITSMHLAATSGKLEIVKVLVEHDANIEATNWLQETPLHRAALFNRVNIVQYLLEIDAKIDCRDKDNETPLMMAVRKNNTAVVKELMRLGADITLKDADDRTCMYIAAEEDCLETLELLLNQPKGRSLIEEFDEGENTPLHVAASKGYIKIVRMLLNFGACIDAKNDQNFTPLHLAAKNGRARIVEILLKRDISIVNDEDDASNTPLHLAALEGHSKVVKTLLSSGAAVDARNASMWTPLDCAASRGWTKCAEALLEGDSPIDPMDWGKTTPLHLASKEGHVDVVKLLLAEKADVSRKDHAGRNCLDLAIENNQKEAALAIVNDVNWKIALRNCTIEGTKVTTPMRKLIKKLPDVAERVFYRCVVSNNLPVEHPDHEVTCNYEFLEDTIMDWGHELGRVRPSHIENEMQKKGWNRKIMKTVAVADYAKKQFQLKDNHPLMIMVKSQRTKLLSHPLVACLLRNKWKACGRYVYYSKLVVYMFYLTFLTGYALYTVKDQYRLTCVRSNVTACQCVVTTQVPNTAGSRLWIDIGKWIVVIIACFSLFLELIQMITLLHNYIRAHNIVELSSYLIALLYILDGFTWNGQRIEIVKHGRCHFWHRSIGALSVWLSWLSLVLFMRKFPKLGIYVVMFTDILKTFAQFFLVFCLFIVAFGLGFHMLLFEQSPFAFSTPAKSMLKTSMGMLGEIEYDNIFNEHHPMPVAWGIYVVYLIINCIILMNLLVGLAVDDIKGVQENAVLKRYAMQIDLTLDVEKALPLYFRRKLLHSEETIRPNEVKPWNFWSFWGTTLKTTVAPQQGPIEKLQARQDELRMNVKSLKNKMKTLQTQNNRMELMLNAIIKHHKISLEYEVDANEDDA